MLCRQNLRRPPCRPSILCKNNDALGIAFAELSIASGKRDLKASLSEIQYLLRLAFIATGNNVVLIGDVGLGKLPGCPEGTARGTAGRA
jgi:hypothetical protein